MQRNILLTLTHGLIALAMFIAPSYAGINSWSIKGPPGGIYHDIEISSSDPNVLYSAYTHSLFRSTDGGANWQTARDFKGDVVDIAVDPSNGNRLFVTTLVEGLFRSDDAGLTFTLVSPQTSPIWSVGVSADGNTVYFATASGSFFRSLDRGQTWAARTSTLATITSILVDSSDSNLIHAVRGGSIMRSVDGGGTWTETALNPVSPFLANVNGLIKPAPNTLIAAANDGVYVSSDNGATWSQRVGGQYASVAASQNAPTTVIAASYSGSLLRSNNLGVSWAPVFGLSPGLVRRVVIRSGLPQLVAANGDGIKLSSNSGSTWVDATSSPIASSPTRMATTIAPNSKIYTYTTSDGVGLFTTAQDAGWQRVDLIRAQSLVNLGQASLAVKPGDPQSIYLGMSFGGVIRSSDGGVTWSGPGAGMTGFGINAMTFDPIDTNVMYAAVSQGPSLPLAALYRSADGGASWSPQSIDLPAVFGLRLAVDPADRSRLFIAGYQGFSRPGTGGLFLSTNSGVNWTRVGFAGMNVRDVAIDPSNSKRVYAATALGLQTSIDGGITFTRNSAFTQISSLQVSAVAIDPVVPTTIYAASLDDGPPPFGQAQAPSVVLRSVDAGQSWETLRSATDSPGWLVGDIILDPNVPSRVYVTTGVQGVATFEIVNDLSVAIAGHSGSRTSNVPSSFNLQVQNSGTLSATSVLLKVTLPPGLTDVSTLTALGQCTLSGDALTCNLPVLPPATSGTITVNYTPTTGKQLPISVNISAHERDAETANNFADATAVLTQSTDLSLSVTTSTASLKQGDSFIYNVKVGNSGPSTALDAVLTFTPPTGVALLNTPTDCIKSGSALTCKLISLPAGATQLLALNATPISAGSLTATAAVVAGADALDTNQTNNTATVTVTSTAPPSKPAWQVLLEALLDWIRKLFQQLVK